MKEKDGSKCEYNQKFFQHSRKKNTALPNRKSPHQILLGK